MRHIYCMIPRPVPAESARGGVRLTVANSGSVIAAVDLRHAVQVHHGTARVSAEPVGGARFEVELGEDRMSDQPMGQHPKGTLLLVGLYGLLFAASWFAVYVFVYLRRAGVTP